MLPINLFFLFAGCRTEPQNPQLFVYNQVHMGGEVRITLYADSSLVAEAAAKSAFEKFRRLDALLSDYQAQSEVSLFNRNGKIEASEELIKILAISRQISIETDGVFDITTGPLVQIWRQSRQQGRLPSQMLTEQAKRLVGYRWLQFDVEKNHVSTRLPGVKIDFGGIAKGYACEAAIRAMAQAGVSRARVEAGGDSAFGDAPPNRPNGWRVAIQGSDRGFDVNNACVSTSGSTEQFVEIDGRRYSHLVDPRTGIGVPHQRQVTIIGHRGAMTDAWATAICIEPRLQTRLRGYQVIIIDRAEVNPN